MEIATHTKLLHSYTGYLHHGYTGNLHHGYTVNLLDDYAGERRKAASCCTPHWTALAIGSLLGCVVAIVAAPHSAEAAGVLRLAALDEKDGIGGTQPMTSCVDDGICNAAVCGISGDPDCRPDNCNADGRCVPAPDCDDDPDCPPPSGRAPGDERVVIQNPARVPFKAIAKVDIGPDGGGRGSAVLVAPCTLLTNGHVVYNREKEKFRAIQRVHPGSYYDEDRGKAVDPYGSKEAVLLATNTSWENTGESQYDYGAIFIESPFSHISATLIPVEFEHEPSFVNLSGYPSEQLPTDRNGAKQEQWRGWGSVEETDDRLVRYAARSTGGASGSPVWVYNATTDTRRLVAINRGHDGQTGIGVRLVSQNQEVITKWMLNSCSIATRSRSAAPMSFSRLVSERRTLSGEPIPMRTAEQLGLVVAPQSPPSSAKARTVVQWIEGEFYQWDEFVVRGSDVEAADIGQTGGNVTATPARRYLRLVTPEQRFLNVDEAAVLLSASMLWQRETASPLQPVYYAPPSKVSAVEAEDAPRRGSAQTPETEVRSRPLN